MFQVNNYVKVKPGVINNFDNYWHDVKRKYRVVDIDEISGGQLYLTLEVTNNYGWKSYKYGNSTYWNVDSKYFVLVDNIVIGGE